MTHPIDKVMDDALNEKSPLLSNVLEINLGAEPELDSTLGVKISGEFYAYAAVNDWSLSSRNRFAHCWQQMQKLERKEEPTDEDEIRYNELTSKFMQMCAPTLPHELIGKLSPANRSALAMDFLIKVAARHPVFKTLGGFMPKTGIN